ncbi:MAG: twin transmembrane helix small protein [Pseudomonadota bacterium]
MQTALTIAFYVTLFAVFAILAMGLINLVRRDAGQASRSNQLMRMRVAVQGVAILLLVLIGVVAGKFSLPW